MRSDVLERPISQVAVEGVLAKTGHIKIGPSIVVEVTHGHSHPVALSRYPGLGRDLSEGPVFVVPIQGMAGWNAGRGMPMSTTVDQIDVQPSIVVVIYKGGSSAHGFNQVFLRSGTVFMGPDNPGLAAHVNKLNLSFGARDGAQQNQKYQADAGES